jgi:tetratricopeptide (TPR) repeat protein
MFRRRLRHILSAISLGLLVGCGPPDPVRKLNQSGLEYYNKGDYYAAITQFENARKLDPELPESSYYLGRCYLRMAEQKMREDNLVAGMRFCDRSASEFERAYNAFPGYTKAIQGKSEALKLRGRQAAALELASWASAHATPRARMMILEAHELAQAGDLDKSLRVLKTAVAVEPENAAAHAELGRFYMRCNNEREAIAALQKAYRLDPGAPGVVSALAELNALPDKPHGGAPAPTDGQ